MIPKRKTAKKKRKEQREECRHCKPGPETYWYLDRQYVFDVDEARQLVADGREPVEVEPDSIERSIELTRIYPEHLPHVDTRFPGIIAHVWLPLPDGETAQGHLLIDGNHRAARCLDLERPFYAYVLTEEESQAILTRKPDPKRALRRAKELAS